MAIVVNSINLYLLSSEELELALDRLAGVLRGVNKQMSIIKLERPTDYSDNIAYEDDVIKTQNEKYAHGELNDDIYDRRLGVAINDKLILESYNSENRIFRNEFYIAVFLGR